MKNKEFLNLYEIKLQANNKYIVPNNLFTEETALKYVLNLKKDKYLNVGVFDLIDYETLIYIYVNFHDNNEINAAVNDVFHGISECYIEKEKYKNKLL